MPTISPADLAPLRVALERAGFTEDALAQLLPADAYLPAINEHQVPMLERRLRGGSPLETVVRLFLLGLVASDREAEGALGDVLRWQAAGFLEQRPGGWAATVALLPRDGLVVAFDLPSRDENGLRPDYVMGIGAASLTLAQHTVRPRCRAAVDVGTGCGYHAFLAAAHSDRVVATDLNPRAVETARVNAGLNGLAVDCRVGDLFTPIAGERFDLIVCNPPFVVSPDTRYVFRDGHELTTRIVAEVADYLEPSGWCQFLANWPTRSGEQLEHALRDVFAGSRCDAWVLLHPSWDPATYATTWIGTTEGDEPQRFARLFDEWMAWYEAERIESLTAGVVTMRRRDAPNWVRIEEAPEESIGPCGGFVMDGFAARHMLETLDDASLLKVALRAAPHARLTQHLSLGEDGWEATAGELRMDEGLAYRGEVDPLTAELVAHCDGAPLREVIHRLAARTGMDVDALTRVAVPAARALIEKGFVMVAVIDD